MPGGLILELNKLFEQAIEVIKAQNIDYAVCGGFVASIYRDEYRNTNDVDIVINPENNALEIATKIITSLGLKAGIARKADLQGGPLFAIRRKSTEACIVVGRFEGQPKGAGVDILLPSMPWVPDAVRRAQYNLIDFGFGAIPAITVEDMIIAKFVSLRDASNRDKDTDDLKSIFRSSKELDLKYIIGQMTKLKVKVPLSVEKSVPDILVKVSKDISKQIRKRINKENDGASR